MSDGDDTDTAQAPQVEGDLTAWPQWTLPRGHFWGRTVEEGPSHIFGEDGESKCNTYSSKDVIEMSAKRSELPEDVCGVCAGVVRYIEIVEGSEE